MHVLSDDAQACFSGFLVQCSELQFGKKFIFRLASAVVTYSSIQAMWAVFPLPWLPFPLIHGTSQRLTRLRTKVRCGGSTEGAACTMSEGFQPECCFEKL
jgi:hypothetical protein